MKLYIVVRRDLPPGAQIAQSLHAFREYVEHHPESEKRWYKTSNIIVILDCANEEELRHLMDQASHIGLKCSPFCEPDRGGELTAVAFEPGSRTSEFLSHLRSALKPAEAG